MNVGQVLRKWRVYSDFVTQYFSRFESGFVSHAKRQHLFVLVLGVKIAEYVVCLYLKIYNETYFFVKLFLLFVK